MKTAEERLTPRKLKLDGKERYTRLFSKKDGSAVSLRSGCVILDKGENIGEHDTETQEEVLIILEGKGELLLAKNDKIDFEKGSALYIPPNTLHDVKNTGESSLKYVFFTCPVRA